MSVKALVLNCTLKQSPADSNTEALARVVMAELERLGVGTQILRVVDHDVLPGVTSDEGAGDGWPAIRQLLGNAEILVIATPTWLGQQSSVCQRAFERMDAMLSETNSDGTPAAYNRVAGVVVVGNEDGAHHIIGTACQALIDIGYTVPGQAWTYWNKGPGPGPEEYSNSHETEWSNATGVTAARNLFAVATALNAHPMSAPPAA